jgi:Immunoglobulin-like domain of bacterial spore germination
MSTQNMLPEIERKDVRQRVPPSPPSQYPQLPPPRPNGNRWTWIAIVTVAFVLLLSVGTLLYVQIGRPGGQSTPASSGKVLPTQPAASTPKPTQPAVTPQPTQPSATQVPGNGTTPAPAANVKWGPQTCPAGAKDPAHWASLIGIKGSSMKIEGISCANVIGDSSLQALVTVRHTNTLALDVYAFDRITSTHPVRLLRLTGLAAGDAKISYYNTLMTAEADLSSPINKGKPESGLTRDLFREFAWSSDQQALTQVAFPGFFPALTRYQAEQDQRSIGPATAWKNDAAQVAKHMAVQMLAWPNNTQTKVLSGGSAKDVDAVVLLTSNSIGKPTVNVTLSRLEGYVHNMWVVLSAQTTGMTITSPQGRATLSSPVTVTGSGPANEGQIGMLYVLDHLYNKIGNVEARGEKGWGPTTFAAQLSYSSTTSPSTQEGVLVLYSSSAADGKINGVVMLKELIG